MPFRVVLCHSVSLLCVPSHYLPFRKVLSMPKTCRRRPRFAPYPGKEVFMRAKHNSLDKDTRLHVEWLESLPYVRKVILGFHSGCRHPHVASGVIVAQKNTERGMRLKSYTTAGVRELHALVTHPRFREALRIRINDRLEKQSA